MFNKKRERNIFVKKQKRNRLFVLKDSSHNKTYFYFMFINLSQLLPDRLLCVIVFYNYVASI